MALPRKLLTDPVRDNSSSRSGYFKAAFTSSTISTGNPSLTMRIAGGRLPKPLALHPHHTNNAPRQKRADRQT